LHSPEHERTMRYHQDVKVETRLLPDLRNVYGSEVHLSKMIMNLVNNAAEAMPEGGILSLATENLVVDRPLTGYEKVDEGEYVRLSVSDSGIGISAEDMHRIFEPFYTKKVMGRSGSGLGMAVVWGTVKDHNGYVDLQSEVGRGTTFSIYFPLTRKSLEDAQFVLPLTEFSGKGETILVVDDRKEQREIASWMLRELGYTPVAVGSGEEAVEYLQNRAVNLLLLDMIMEPGMDGLDTLKEILQIHPEQKAILVSGYSETTRVKEAQRLGAGPYLKKPYTLQELGLAIQAELTRVRT
jgi:two-component system, cell cycle sensor histidine kinase and response regulator CckA